MKIMKLFMALCFILTTVHPIKAQATLDDLATEWERAKAYTKEYLDAMPEAEYSLKPTPEMRSFAEQMLHLADDNYVFASATTGAKSPVGMGELEKTSDKTKDDVTKAVLASYDFVINSIRKMTSAQLNEKIKLFDRFELSREMALAKGFEHQTHHRGQTTVYLRLAKVKPPQEKLF
jgi:uncharacterized damage-inducible protein DinB